MQLDYYLFVTICLPIAFYLIIYGIFMYKIVI